MPSERNYHRRASKFSTSPAPPAFLEPNIGIRISKFVQFLSFFIKRSLLHQDTNFAQPVDSPFCLRMPVQRTVILRPDVQRGCRLGSNFLKADS